MKVRVTRKGVHHGSKELVPVGTILEVKGDVMPPHLVSKAEVVDERPEAEEKAEEKVEEKVEEKAEEKTVATGKAGDGPKPNEKKG